MPSRPNTTRPLSPELPSNASVTSRSRTSASAPPSSLARAQRRCALAVADRLGVGEVDEVIVGEPRMEGDIHQTAVAVGPDRRHARNRLRVEHAVANDTEPAGPLGDQHAAVGKERDGPRMRESPGHDADADLVLLGGVEHPGSRARAAAPARRWRGSWAWPGASMQPRSKGATKRVECLTLMRILPCERHQYRAPGRVAMTLRRDRNKVLGFSRRLRWVLGCVAVLSWSRCMRCRRDACPGLDSRAGAALQSRRTSERRTSNRWVSCHQR